MSKPVQSKPTQDIGVAQRFSLFRKKYVEQNQTRAAEAIGMPQAYLSQIENGTRPIAFKYIKGLVKNSNNRKSKLHHERYACQD